MLTLCFTGSLALDKSVRASEPQSSSSRKWGEDVNHQSWGGISQSANRVVALAWHTAKAPSSGHRGPGEPHASQSVFISTVCPAGTGSSLCQCTSIYFSLQPGRLPWVCHEYLKRAGNLLPLQGERSVNNSAMNRD